MINYDAMRTTEVPESALQAYLKYNGDQHAAAKARDDDALSKMQAWGAFIEIQGLAGQATTDEDESGACRLCGEDGGTGCGMPGCQY